MSAENIESKPTQLDREKLKAELMRPPFIEGLSTKRQRSHEVQLTAEQRRSKAEK